MQHNDQVTRKGAQSVYFGGLRLPRGSHPTRTCDLTGCQEVSTELVSEATGSVLFVCSDHASSLTASSGRRSVGEAQTHRRSLKCSGQVRAARMLGLVLGLVLLPTAALFGVGLVIFGLICCAHDSSHRAGILIGVLGCWMLWQGLRPRYDRL